MKCMSLLCLLVVSVATLTCGEPLHPRLFLNAEELDKRRLEWSSPPFNEMRLIILDQAAADSGEPLTDLYDLRIRWHMLAWLLNKEESHLNRVKDLTKEMLDLEEWSDRRFKGLSRAFALTTISLAYDLTSSHWPDSLRQQTSQELYTVAVQLQHSMGKGGNNRLASNWMAVRYAASGLALLACDEPNTKGPLYVAYGQMINHLKASLGEGVWSPEGLGYFIYPMSFTGLFAQAAERSGLGDLRQDVPNLAKAGLVAYHATTEGLASQLKYGYQIDFANDNPGLGFRGLAGNLLWLTAFEPDLNDHVTDMFETRVGHRGPKIYEPWDASFLPGLLHYRPLTKKPAEIVRPNLLLHDAQHGAVISRNGWDRLNDIVVGINGPHRRLWGVHRGPDTNALRIIGLNGVFVTGAGRTGNPIGTTGVFPAVIPTKVPHEELGRLSVLSQNTKGSFVASIQGNQFGISHHNRLLAVDYGATGIPMVMVVRDVAAGARRWRLATLEANAVTILENGFTISAPNGATLSATVIDNGTSAPPRISTESIPRGTRSGIAMHYHGKAIANNTVIEVSCTDRMTMVLTLSDTKDPIAIHHDNKLLQIGENNFTISTDTITGGGLP